MNPFRHLTKVMRERAEAVTGKRDRYRRVFSGKDGEAVLRDILNRCGVGTDAFVPGDPGHTTYNTGKQSVAAGILRTLRLSDDIVCRLLEDQQAIIEDEKDESYG